MNYPHLCRNYTLFVDTLSWDQQFFSFFFFLPPSLTLFLFFFFSPVFLLRSLSLPHPIVFSLYLWDDEWSYMEIITKMSPHLCNWGTAPISWASSWLSGKESTCQCRSHRRHEFDPWVGKNPWRRNGNSLQYSCWDNSTKAQLTPSMCLNFTITSAMPTCHWDTVCQRK